MQAIPFESGFQQPKPTMQPPEQSFAQRLFHWVEKTRHTAANAEHFEDGELDLAQRVRESGEW